MVQLGTQYYLFINPLVLYVIKFILNLVYHYRLMPTLSQVNFLCDTNGYTSASGQEIIYMKRQLRILWNR